MHQIRLNLTQTKNVFVTKHAIDRLKQRCKFYFTKAELNDLDFTIRKEFKHSWLDMKFETSPFDRNKTDTSHGVGSFITTTKRLKIIGNYNQQLNNIRITTVLLNKK